MKKKTKKKPRRNVKREYNLEDSYLEMDHGAPIGKIRYPFNDMPYNVLMKLAMIGAGSLLCKVDKPLVLWEKILQNKFGRERNYNNLPKVVTALSRVDKISIEKAAKLWKTMNRQDRDELKKNPVIKRELLQMQIEELD